MYKKILLIITCFIIGIAYAELIPISKTGEYPSITNRKPVSNSVPISTRTNLLEESFTGTTFPPTGWTRIQTNTGISGTHPCYWARNTDLIVTDPGYHTAPASAGLWWSYDHQEEWLITPSITLTGSPGGVYYLKWWYYGFCGSVNLDHYYTKISTNGGTTWTVLYDLTTQTGGWNYWATPVEINLNAYADSTIKIAFHADDPPTNDGLWYVWFIDDVEVGYPAANDVGVDAILSPGAYHTPNTLMTPSASVKNYGGAAQTNFQVVCSIVGPAGVFRYTNTKIVTSLAAGATTTVNFDPWTPTIQEVVTVMMKTTLAGDQNPANDRKTRVTNIANVYSQDFESSNGNFVPDPLTGAWEWGVPASGPSAAHSGTKLWATLLGGQYPISANWKLTSPQYTATVNNPTLKFWHWYEMEASWDGGNVKISTNGTDWTVITPVGGYNGTANVANAGIPGEACYTGTTTGNSWNEATFNLTLTSGQTFYLRWHFGSDNSVNYAGWYIDDVLGDGFGPQPPPTNDVGVDAIIAPLSVHQVNVQMIPSATVKNYGTAVQSNFQVVCSIVGPAGVFRYTNTQTVTSLTAGATTTVNFTPWTPTIQEAVTVMMKTTLAGDQNPANDRKSRATLISDYMMLEGFNDVTFPPTGWQAIPIVGTYNWVRNVTNTNPTCTPYEGEAMASYQCYSATSGSMARLISPAIAVGTSPKLCTLRFWMYHDPGYPGPTDLGPDSVKVEYSTNGTIFTQVAAFRRYEATAAWTEHAVYLGTFSGTIYLGFVAFSQFGNNVNIDYVRLSGRSTGIEENPNKLPTITSLNAPKPNPVTNGLAKISFTISEPTRASLKIYDASGRVIRTLVNTNLESGVYNLTWNGTDDNSNAVAEGIYFYTLTTDNNNYTKKLVFTR